MYTAYESSFIQFKMDDKDVFVVVIVRDGVPQVTWHAEFDAKIDKGRWEEVEVAGDAMQSSCTGTQWVRQYFFPLFPTISELKEYAASNNFEWGRDISDAVVIGRSGICVTLEQSKPAKTLKI